VLIKESRPRPYETHLAGKDTRQLRQFVKACSTQKAAEGSYVHLATMEKVRCDYRSSDPHCSELWHEKETVVLADTIGPIQGWPLRCESYQRRHKEPWQQE